MQKGDHGLFVVSLDFELLWGVHEHETKETFKKQIFGARKVIPKILALFEEYSIHATWALVGMLMADNKDDLLQYSPSNLPSYNDQKLSSYQYLDSVGKDESEDPFHYAGSLLEQLLKTDNQEIASHTFSHYYCKSEGQTLSQFSEDMDSAQRITKDKTGSSATSLIFPRNQFTEEYAIEAIKHGFRCVRGNPKSVAYDGKSMKARVVRLIDTYINVCGMKCVSIRDCKQENYVNIPASRFFRKYNTKLCLLEPLKILCIKRQMKYAAKNHKVFHLWWHPHNVSINSEKSLKQLRRLFEYYKLLNEKYQFESLNMREVADLV